MADPVQDSFINICGMMWGLWQTWQEISPPPLSLDPTAREDRGPEEGAGAGQIEDPRSHASAGRECLCPCLLGIVSSLSKSSDKNVAVHKNKRWQRKYFWEESKNNLIYSDKAQQKLKYKGEMVCWLSVIILKVTGNGPLQGKETSVALLQNAKNRCVQSKQNLKVCYGDTPTLSRDGNFSQQAQSVSLRNLIFSQRSRFEEFMTLYSPT